MDQFQLILIVISLIAVVTTMLMFRKNPGSVFNGFRLLGTLGILFTTFVYFSFLSNIRFFVIITVILMVIILSIMFFGTGILFVSLLLNTRTILKKEGFGFHNLLTFFAAIGMLMLMIVPPLIQAYIPRDYSLLLMIVEAITFTVYYFIFVFILFITSLWMYQYIRIKKHVDYIIVLGSGLINGDQVSVLLGSRIDRALECYKKQDEKPMIIFSGGQGPDELVSEGYAMQQYAMKKGLPESDSIVEDKSTTTFENMKFSKQIIDEREMDKEYQVAFSSNNYHIFRADRYAKQAGLKKAHGLSAKTARYFLPNAILREYVAFMVITKKAHITLLAFVYLFLLFGYIIQSII